MSEHSHSSATPTRFGAGTLGRVVGPLSAVAIATPDTGLAALMSLDDLRRTFEEARRDAIADGDPLPSPAAIALFAGLAQTLADSCAAEYWGSRRPLARMSANIDYDGRIEIVAQYPGAFRRALIVSRDGTTYKTIEAMPDGTTRSTVTVV